MNKNQHWANCCFICTHTWTHMDEEKLAHEKKQMSKHTSCLISANWVSCHPEHHLLTQASAKFIFFSACLSSLNLFEFLPFVLSHLQSLTHIPSVPQDPTLLDSARKSKPNCLTFSFTFCKYNGFDVSKWLLCSPHSYSVCESWLCVGSEDIIMLPLWWRLS